MNIDMNKLYNALTPEQKRAADAFLGTIQENFDKFDWASFVAGPPRRNWIVSTRLADDGCSVEVAAVIENSHGHKSWGWHDDGQSKYVVLSTSYAEGQKTPVLRSIIVQAEEEARRICRINN